MATPVTVSGRPVGKWRGSWLLCRETFRFLSADKEIVLIPLIATLLNFFLWGILVVVYYLSGGFSNLTANSDEVTLRPLDYVLIFSSYVLTAYTIALAQAAIAHTVYTRAHGGNATLGQSLGVAFGHSAALLGWSVVTSTVGLIIQAIAERTPFGRRVVAMVLGVGWNVLTFFVVPSIVLGNKSFYHAMGYSGALFKRTWGELVVSNITLGLVFFLAQLLAFTSFFGLLMVGIATGNIVLMVVVVVAAVVWLLGSLLIYSALQSVLKTLLYVYAAEAKVPENFNRELLEAVLTRSAALPKKADTAPLEGALPQDLNK